MTAGRWWLTRRGLTAVTIYLLVASGLSALSGALDRRFQTDHGLTLSFYDNAAFQGEPVLQQTTAEINLAFLEERPNLPRRFFSVRWEGVWYVPHAQTVDLHVGGDDRVVVALDGRTVHERSIETGFHSESRSLAVAPGFHDLRVSYEQYGGGYGLAVSFAATGKAPRAFDPEALFPSAPSRRALDINQRLRLLRRVALWAWLAPPIVLLALVSLSQWLTGTAVFLVALLGYWLNVLHFEPVVFTRRQNIIFSADTWTTIGSMTELTFRDHIRQHPFFSLVTSTLVRLFEAVPPIGLNQAILMTLTLIAAVNCTLGYVILQRQLASTRLACWFAALYGCLFINLALFSIPETYTLSTSAVLVYILSATAVRSPIGTRQLCRLTLLATLAGLFNPPLLSLSVIHLAMLLRDRGARGTLVPAVSSLAASALLYVLANRTIFGPEFYLNFAVDSERYGSIGHFQDPASIGTVFCGLFLFAVVAPRGQLTHHFAVSDLTGYLQSLPGGVAIAVYAAFMLYVLWRIRPWKDSLVLGLLIWLLTMTAFYVYFNPDGVMLYSVQVLLLPLLFAAREFQRITPAFNLKYVLLGVFSGLMTLRNVSAVYAQIEILP